MWCQQKFVQLGRANTRGARNPSVENPQVHAQRKKKMYEIMSIEHTAEWRAQQIGSSIGQPATAHDVSGRSRSTSKQ